MFLIRSNMSRAVLSNATIKNESALLIRISSPKVTKGNRKTAFHVELCHLGDQSRSIQGPLQTPPPMERRIEQRLKISVRPAPELGSGSTPHRSEQTGCIQRVTTSEEWMLKQRPAARQHDGDSDFRRDALGFDNLCAASYW
jgi:hypothetical protein